MSGVKNRVTVKGTVQARKTVRGGIGYRTLQGEPGKDGISPQARVDKSGDTVTITITDAEGTTTETVKDGQTPQKGVDYLTPEEVHEVAEEVLQDKIITDMQDDITDVKGSLNQKLDITAVPEMLTGVPENVNTDATESDFDIVDEDGNVLARFYDGHIKTKNFDSSDSGGSEDIYDAAEVKKTNSPADFDIVDFNGNSVAQFDNGHIRTKNFDSRAITPIVITVKADGTGDFTSLRAAVDSITDADYFKKPYEIDVYPGTYNVLADYTSEEILTEEFYGLVLTDGIDIKGIGNRDEIVLHGELSTESYDSTKRNDISTLNLQDSGRIENITVTAKSIRYCVHDDLPPKNTYVHRHTKNCKFRGVSLTSGTELKTWGEGSRHGKTSILEDCDFGTTFLWHSDNTASTTLPQTLIVKNCTARYALIANRNHQVLNNVHLYNNHFTLISINFNNVSSTNYMMTVDGTGHDAMTYAPVDWNYMNGDIERFYTDGTQSWSIGQMVVPSATPHWASGPLAVCTDPAVAYGVVVGTDSEWIYVQKRGYIHAERLGFSGVSVGDKITATAQGGLEVNGSGNVFGVVTCVTSAYGSFIRRTA